MTSRVLLSLLAIIGATVLGVTYWCWAVSIDETITSGSQWGVVIGESKEQTIRRLRSEYDPAKLHITFPDSDTAAPRYLGLLVEAPAKLLTEQNEWLVFLIDEGTDLTLVFEDGVLGSARMVRRPCEFP